MLRLLREREFPTREIVAFASERAGVFDAAAHLVARLAGGSGRRLLVWVYLLGVVVTAFLSNDATALLLTPVVFRRSPSARYSTASGGSRWSGG